MDIWPGNLPDFSMDTFVSFFWSESSIWKNSQCIDYFVARGSAVYVAALDAKKAFDRVNHVKLFIKLCHYGLPLPIIRLTVDWYSKLYSLVR